MPDNELSERLLARDRSAVPEALNLVDDRRPERRAEAIALLDHLHREIGNGGAARIGLTGAPGSGKSSLLDVLVRSERARKHSLGIIAVDPSSPLSGGALLGDRMRIRSGATDTNVFLRSMAARDPLGGLAEATHAGVLILSAVFDRVFVETVGVGQSESDVAHLVDTLVFVTQPGGGDLLQFMKAGILEFPDLFVVNKSDLGRSAERSAAELRAGLGLSESRDGDWCPPVILTSALEDRGIDEVIDALGAHRRQLEASEELARRRERGRIAYLRDVLGRRYGSYGIECIGGRATLESRIREAGASSAFRLAHELSSKIEDALRKSL